MVQQSGAEVKQNPYHVDYQQILEGISSDELGSIIRKLSDELPHDWVDAYKLANGQQANILRIMHDGFEYLFDHSCALVLRGQVAKDSAVGVLKTDGKLWLAQFPNCDSSEEMAIIERLFRAKIAGSEDDSLRSIL